MTDRWTRYRHFTLVSERDQLEGEEREACKERILAGDEDRLITAETREAAADYKAKRSPANTHGGYKMLPVVLAGGVR
jgi:hypothetical protein